MTSERSRRPRPPRVFLLLLTLVLSACDGGQGADGRYHHGLLFLATGNTTGTYYQYGGGYADVVNRHVRGYEMRAEPTGASGENVERVSRGDMDLGLAHADIAADGAIGRFAFEGKPQRVVALARLYNNIAQIVVRSNLRVQKLSDLRGKKISTSTLNSGTDNVAGRMLEAAGLDENRDYTRLRLSLPETTKGMKAGEIDALIFVAGLPTIGITELMNSSPGKFMFLPADDLLKSMNDKYGGIYQQVTIPKSVYHWESDIQTVAIPTMLVASPDVPEPLAYQLTKVLYEHQTEMAAAHAEGANHAKATGKLTNPVPLHPGARRFYDGG